MEKNTIIWKGLNVPSLENCTIVYRKKKITITSKIVGRVDNTDFSVEYNIQTNELWETASFSMLLTMDGEEKTIEGKKDKEDHWIINGELLPNLDNYKDIDISLTPFTNSLLINRANLGLGEEATFDVLHIDVLQRKVTQIKQKYTHIDDNEYVYHNLNSDFESHIFVDDEGIVTEYPELFERQ